MECEPPVPVGATDPEPKAITKPRVWPTYLTFALSLGTVIVASTIFMVIGMAIMVAVEMTVSGGGPPPNLDALFSDDQALNRLLGNPWFLLCLIVLSSGTFFFAALAGGFFSREDIRDRLAIRRPVVAPAWLWLLIPFGGLAISSGFDDISRLLSLQSESLALFEKLFSSTGGFGFALTLLLVGGFVPIAEEGLFRGYIQTRLVQRHGARLGVVLASAMFGIMHMDLVHSIYATLIGLYLGHIALRCNSIWPAVAAHATVNTVSCLGARFLGGGDMDPGLGYILADLAVCMVVVAAIVRLVERQPRKALPATLLPDGEVGLS